MIQCLDKGYVRLVDMMGDDYSPIRAARISTGTDTIETEEDIDKNNKLLQYLLDEKHTSPFESIAFTFEIKAPIMVVRQWHRHRTWSYNELSARYTPLEKDYYIPSIENIGTQGFLQKQTREIEPSDITEEERLKLQETLDKFSKECFSSHELYEKLLEEGQWPRELARTVLSVGIYTRMYATVNLHNLFHFLRLRNHEHAQYEIRVYAQAIEKIVEEKLPRIYKTWKKSNQTEYLKKVRKFHEKFGLVYDGTPKFLDEETYSFRTKFLQEELDEYKEAVENKDLVKQFDALIDLLVVTVGTAHLQGFPLDKGFTEVMNANMKKRKAKDSNESKRGSSLDIVKPEGWQSPEDKLQLLLIENGANI